MASIVKLLEKLIKQGFTKRSSLNKLFPKGELKLSKLSQQQILNYYYSCMHNRNTL